MIVLALGSNLGDRLAQMRKALRHLMAPPISLRKIRSSSIYKTRALTPEGAPDSWDSDFFNSILVGETELSPQALLSEIKTIEQKLGRQERQRWAPREIDIDILFYNDDSIDEDNLKIPHPEVLKRDFVMTPLMEVLPRFHFPHCESETLLRPLEKSCTKVSPSLTASEIVGTLNCTPDSFSDGGHYEEVQTAIEHTLSMVQSGATIIDIGAESTRPGLRSPLSLDEEWRRLNPIIAELKSQLKTHPCPPKISIDTRHVQTAERALEMGVDWINDVTGFDDPQMRALLRQTEKEIVIMHHLGVPPQKDRILSQEVPPIQQISQWIEEKKSLFLKEGFALERLIFDPGIGFGKSAEQSLELLQNISSLSHERLLVGHSRKSFLTLLTQAPPIERDPETATISAQLQRNHVEFLRVHNVSMTHKTLTADLAFL